MAASWWANECPARGPGLTHTNDGDGYCAECGWNEESYRVLTHGDGPAPPPEPIDIPERLRALGLGAFGMTASPIAPDTRDPILVEPKMITGDGPQGPVIDAPGGGPLSSWNIAHLEFAIWWREKHGIIDGPFG